MQPQIIGVSGSPVKNSNTDRLVKAVLESSGLSYEFVKLSKKNIRPCLACLGCKDDNVCKVDDDFAALAEKIKKAGALVVGTYASYGSIDGFTKAFLERLFSLRHRFGLNRGKLAVAITTGNGRGAPGLNETSIMLSHALSKEGMNVLKRLTVIGNPECMVCGYGKTCPMSALPKVLGEDTIVTPEKFSKVEDQKEVWEKAEELGREIAALLKDSKV